MKDTSAEVLTAVKEIKSAIVWAQSRVAANANAELLMLYFGIGRYVSNKTKTEKWGTGVIDTISAQLQKEMPGLRGFSGKSIRKMRQFFEIWNEGAIWPTASAKLDEKNGMGENHSSQPINLEEAVIWPTMPAKLESGNPTSAATIEFFSMSQREDGHDAVQRATPRRRRHSRFALNPFSTRNSQLITHNPPAIVNRTIVNSIHYHLPNTHYSPLEAERIPLPLLPYSVRRRGGVATSASRLISTLNHQLTQSQILPTTIYPLSTTNSESGKDSASPFAAQRATTGASSPLPLRT